MEIERKLSEKISLQNKNNKIEPLDLKIINTVVLKMHTLHKYCIKKLAKFK